jgi:hypothetical protein
MCLCVVDVHLIHAVNTRCPRLRADRGGGGAPVRAGVESGWVPRMGAAAASGRSRPPLPPPVVFARSSRSYLHDTSHHPEHWHQLDNACRACMGQANVGSEALTTGSGRHLAVLGWVTSMSPLECVHVPLPSRLPYVNPRPHATDARSYKGPTAAPTGPRAPCLFLVRRRGTHS